MRAAGGALSSILLGAGFAILGGAFDAEPLFVGGIAFLALGGATLLWVTLAARGARVSRDLTAHRVIEDEPFDVRLAATSALPLPGGELVEPLLPGPVPLRPGRRETRIRVQARFARRGLRRLDPPRMTIHDPLGLAARTILGGGSGDAASSGGAASAADEVLVLPRIEPVDVTAEPDASGSGRALASLAGMAEVEMDGLRAYREGTAASRIHWPPLARGAGLMERRLRPDGDGRPLVVLDPRGGTEADLDAAVRAAASLCRALAASGGCGLLLPGERRA
ncbi:MAG TPA: DUF58 domain-containing protein, partial [Solirubrobacteraceae bacterium]|nr:DUF58 domain-containing protein [Solirubrobacteraceae bacterium]